VNFLRPARAEGGELIATGMVTHRGRRPSIADTVVTYQGRRIAVATGTTALAPLN
jgi:acyl-coenzyme A thioesterase PaaI-like protein